jgi:hypothetical protein
MPFRIASIVKCLDVTPTETLVFAARIRSTNSHLQRVMVTDTMNFRIARIQYRAFRLIELPVLIVIVAILASLLMPVLSAARLRAAQATCLTPEFSADVNNNLASK